MKLLGLRRHEGFGAEVAAVRAHAGVEAVVDFQGLAVPGFVRAEVAGVDLGAVALVDHAVDLEGARVVEALVAGGTLVIPAKVNPF